MKKSKNFKKLKPKTAELLLQQKEQAFLSKYLSEIEKNVPIDFTPKGLSWGEYDKEKISQMLKRLEFYSLVKRLPEKRQKTITGGENLKLW